MTDSVTAKADPVSLASLLTPSKTVSIDFPGYKGFKLDICYLGRDELLKLRKKCVSTKFNKRTHQPEETLDEDKFLEEYVSAVIKGWSGLKFSYLEEFLLVDISKQNPDDELPFTQDNAELLMRNSNSFDSWITDTVSNLENFTGSK
jgi:hypothetical protein